MIRYEHAVCPFCALLCDDLTITVEGKNVMSSGGCAMARTRFAQAARATIEPTVDGQVVSLSEALSRAAQILTEARQPLVLLSGHQSSEASRAAADLAAALGGCIDGPRAIAGTLRALTEMSLVSATLGEVRNRADVIVCWKADPLTTHPRLLERIVEAPGLYRPRGRADRTLVVVDDQETETARAADLWLRPAPDAADGGRSLASLIWTLRALVAGRQVGEEEALHAGLPLQAMTALAGMLRTARYGALFYAETPPATQGGDKRAHDSLPAVDLEGLLNLIDDLNTVSRWTAFGLPMTPNVWGTATGLASATGYGHAISYTGGVALHNREEFSAPALLGNGIVDAVLAIGGGPDEGLADGMIGLPLIVVEGQPSPLSAHATVRLPVALPGVTAGGTMSRLDRVALPLRAVVDSPWPDDVTLLRALRQEIG